MHRLPARERVTLLSIVTATLALCGTPLHAADQNGWRSIFNGRDVSGWTTYVSRQPTARGKISVQSEGAEAFFRNIVIGRLDQPAARYAAAMRN